MAGKAKGLKRVLIYLGCCAVLAFALAIALALAGAAPAAVAHAAFALGAMPLIFAAMGHFVPVLTRSAGAAPTVHRLPLAMQAAGAAAVGVLAGALPGWALHGAVALGLAATGGFLGWQWRRGRAALGKPHPGLAWYQAALGCLLLALLAILVGLLWPAGYAALRLVHLHLNTLGFIGLTAIGTLHVLMPTVLGQPDPLAAQRLRRQLPWALGGVALSALAGVLPWLTLPGALLMGGVVAHTLTGWVKTHGWRRIVGDGAAVALMGAGVGLLAAMAIVFSLKFVVVEHFCAVIKRLIPHAGFHRLLNKKLDGLLELENYVFDFFRKHPKDFFWVMLGETVFHLAGVAEVYLTLKLTGANPSITAAFILEALNRLINLLFAFVPAKVGVDEVGSAWLADTLGFTTAAGVTLAIYRKLRLLCWTAIGLVCLATLTKTLKGEATQRQ